MTFAPACDAADDATYAGGARTTAYRVAERGSSRIRLRQACYYLLFVHEGRLLPGKKILPERIRENHDAYIEALIAADKAWEYGQVDINSMESCVVS